MNNKDIEKKLKHELDSQVPNVLDKILSECGKQKGEIVSMTQVKKKKRWLVPAIAAAVFAFILLAATGYIQFRTYNTVDSVIALDVNPSMELKINSSEKVLEVNALNEDAVKILDGMDLKNTELKVAVNALIGSMLKNNYINDMQNSILVSVENSDSSKSNELMQKLIPEINGYFQNNSIEAAILSQTINEDAKIQELSDKYGISHGKAALIQKITSTNELLTEQELSKLSINELNLLVSSKNTELPDVASTGTASDKSYIGAEEAKKIAFGDAGVNQESAYDLKVEMDSDDGIMVYEVEFKSSGWEYDYEVDAVSGQIKKSELEKDDDYKVQTPSGNTDKPTTNNSQENNTVIPNESQNDSGNTSAADYLTREKAEEIVFKHAGVKESDVYGLKISLDNDDGQKTYEIEFKSGNLEYDYEINAYSGKILSYDREYKYNDSDVSTGNSNSSGKELIGEAKAKAKVLSHSGVSENSIIGFKIEVDSDDRTVIYEIEFKVNNLEYEYELNAYTGEIISYDIDD